MFVEDSGNGSRQENDTLPCENSMNLALLGSTTNKYERPDDGCNIEELCPPTEHSLERTKAATWIGTPPIKQLRVRFTPNAEIQLGQFLSYSVDPECRFLRDVDSLKRAIVDILQADPRSTYRRKKCDDKLYFFVLDRVHVTTWFDDTCVEVVRVKPVSDIDNTKCMKSESSNCVTV